MLDDQESNVDAGGFGEGFHEGIVPIMVIYYLENILVSASAATRYLLVWRTHIGVDEMEGS